MIKQSELKERVEAVKSRDLKTYPSDHRRYRYLELSNGLRILLIENNRAPLAEVALSVQAGGYDEPDEPNESDNFPGLAHLLEHMVFMGSRKFPGEFNFKRDVELNGGSINETRTMEECTVYPFTIAEEHLDSSLDKFSAFFIAPLLDETKTKQEIETINQEFMMNLEEDGFRSMHIDKLTINPKHPGRRFDWGNAAVLNKVKDNLHKALVEFHDRYYTADRMILVINSSRSLNELQSMAVKYFSGIHSASQKMEFNLISKQSSAARFKLGPSPRLKPKVPKYLPSSLQNITTIESKQNNNALGISFFFSAEKSLELEHAIAYVLFLLNSRSPHGLMQQAKQRGWTLERSSGDLTFNADVEYHDDIQVEISIVFPLSSLGMTKINDILTLTLSYIQFLQKEGLDQELFKNFQKLSELDLLYAADNMGDHDDFINHLKDYSIDRFFEGSKILSSDPFPEKLIQKVLVNLTPDKMAMLVIQGSPIENKEEQELKEKQELIEIEPYTGAKFKRVAFKDTISFKNYSSNRSENINHSSENKNKFDFKMPKATPYFPENFTLIQPLEKFRFPNLILNRARMRAWLSHDLHFKTKPFVITQCYFNSGVGNNTAKNSMQLSLFMNLLSIEFSKTLYTDFHLADAKADFNITPRGIVLKVTSYSHKHEAMVVAFTKIIRNFCVNGLNQDVLNRCKTIQHEGMSAHQTKSPDEFCLLHVGILLDEFNFTIEERLEALKEIDIKSMNEFVQNFLNSAAFEMYSHGNINDEQIVKLTLEIGKILQFDNSDASLSINASLIPPASHLVSLPPSSQSLMVQSKLNNQAVVVYYQYKGNANKVTDNGNPNIDHTLEIRYMLNLLVTIMKPSYFSALRVQGRLAYNLNCITLSNANQLGLAFYIQSDSETTVELSETNEGDETEETAKQDESAEIAEIVENSTVKEKITPSILVQRIEQFIAEFESVLKLMDEEQYCSYAKSLDDINKKGLVCPQSLTEYTENFSYDFNYGQYDFESQFKNLEPYMQISKERLLAFFKELFDLKAQRQIIIYTAGEGQLEHGRARPIQDIVKFKRESEYFPDCLAKSETLVQSFSTKSPKEDALKPVIRFEIDKKIEINKTRNFDPKIIGDLANSEDSLQASNLQQVEYNKFLNSDINSKDNSIPLNINSISGSYSGDIFNCTKINLNFNGGRSDYLGFSSDAVVQVAVNVNTQLSTSFFAYSPDRWLPKNNIENETIESETKIENEILSKTKNNVEAASINDVNFIHGANSINGLTTIIFAKNCGITPGFIVPQDASKSIQVKQEGKILADPDPAVLLERSEKFKKGYAELYSAILEQSRLISNNVQSTIYYLNAKENRISKEIKHNQEVVYIHSDANELIIDNSIKIDGILIIACRGKIILNAEIEAQECYLFCREVGAADKDINIKCLGSQFSIMTIDAISAPENQFNEILQSLEKCYLANETAATQTNFQNMNRCLRRLAYLNPYLKNVVNSLFVSKGLDDIIQSRSYSDINAFVPVLEYLDLNIPSIKMGEKFTPLFSMKTFSLQNSLNAQNSVNSQSSTNSQNKKNPQKFTNRDSRLRGNDDS